MSKYFGGDGRTPLSGGNSGGIWADIRHDFLFVEHKHKARHAVVSLWDTVKALAKKESKISIVTLSVKGRPGFWIMVHWDDLTAVANQREQAKNT